MSNLDLGVNAGEAWDKFRDQVRHGQCDFKDIRFPEDPTLKCFKGLVFTEGANFNGAVFEGVVYFNQATFDIWTDFSGTAFENEANFREVVFKNNVTFNEKTIFKRHCDFTKATFGQTLLFTGVIARSGIFHYVRFIGPAEFERTHFGNVEFSWAVFEHYANFNWVQVDNDARFLSVSFMRSATFNDCRFNGIAKFGGARAVERVELPMPACNKDKRVFRFPEQGVTAYRFAKQVAASLGDSIAASDYHYAERCAVDAEMRSYWSATAYRFEPKSKRAWEAMKGWFQFVVMRSFFGYGEKPLRVMGASIFVILMFAFVYWYWQMGCVSAKDTCKDTYDVLSFPDALFLSVTTFTTLGYADYHLPIGISRFLIGGEAFLGTFFMSTYAVVLGRRYLE